MRRFETLLLAGSLLGLGACHSSPDSAQTKQEAAASVSTAPPKPAEAAPPAAQPAKEVSVYDLPTLRTAYVTRPAGQAFYEVPTASGIQLGELTYGQQVEVIGYRDGADGRWAELKLRTERTRTEEGHEVTTWAWEKMYVPATSLGELAAVRLLGPELAADAAVSFADSARHPPLADSLTLQLLPNKQWPAAGAATVLKRPASVRRQGGGRLELRIGEAPGYVTLRDKNPPEDETAVERYEYLGEVDALNAYVVGVSYYENQGYRLIDRRSGRPREELTALPHLSPDGQYLLCVSGDIYNDAAVVELYRVANGQLRAVLTASFPHWAPADEPTTMRWLSPRQAVIRAGHPSTYHSESNQLSADQFQVLQLTIR
jgi:hypothetical protein